MLGLPIAFKDLQPVAGVPVTYGSAVLPPTIAEEDARAVGLIRAAGAVTLGTTQAPELGIPCYTDTAVVGRPAVTPYDTSRYASGSSGGAAAAVAAGLIPVGHGTDGAGSVRTPSAVCGLVGVKPSRGVVSTAPQETFLGFVTAGPLARTVADAALLLDAMADRTPTGIYGVSAAPTESFLDAAGHPPTRPLRLAFWTDSGLAEPDPEAVLAVGRVTALLAELGHSVLEITNPAPWDDTAAEALVDCVAGTTSAALAELPKSVASHLQDLTQWMLERGDRLSANDLLRSLTVLAELSAGLVAGIAGFDAVITPTATGPAVPVGHYHLEGVERVARRMLDWSAYTPLLNTSGLPAVSLPVHVTPEGLPVGVQIAASRHGDDQLLLSLGAQIESAVGWAGRHPAQWSV